MKLRALTFVVFVAGAAACGPTVGDPCTTPNDCLGRACLNAAGFAGGYCSVECTMDGARACPTGSICVREALGPGTHACMRACNNTRECRPTYRCERERGSDSPVCTGGL
ncbi:MAG: hypothetical protein JNK82_02300 [Myxococcaceae bacterium]|nr:hypothetical protein [Myxococcaceae bacterium]